MTIYLLFAGIGIVTLTIISEATGTHPDRASAAFAALARHAVASQTELGRGAMPGAFSGQPVADPSCGGTTIEESDVRDSIDHMRERRP